MLTSSHHPDTRSQWAVSMLLSAAILLAIGCTSYRTTTVDRRDDDSLVAQRCTTRGIPVKLKVPSHMEVKIVETFFIGPGPSTTIASVEPDIAKTVSEINLHLDDHGRVARLPGQEPSVTVKGKLKLTPPMPVEIRPKRSILTLETELQYTDKVFTVDFPRPLAGSLKIGGVKEDGIKLDSEQYFGSLQASYQERTLGAITELLGGSVVGDTKSTTSLNVLDQPSYQRLTRVVAFERFDISQCGWEQRMQEFIDLHLGDIHQAEAISWKPEDTNPDAVWISESLSMPGKPEALDSAQPQ